MAQEISTTWSPKEEKGVRLFVNGILGIVAITVVAVGVIKILPVWTKAFDIINLALSSLISMAITGVIGLALFLLVKEVFFGKLRDLIVQYYNIGVRKATLAAFNIDPISPMTDKQAELKAKQIEFDEAFADVEGVIENFKQSEQRYRKDAAKAERIAQQANLDGDKATFATQSSTYGKFKETADDFLTYQNQLVPVRDTMLQLRAATVQMIDELDVDIRIFGDKWEAQKGLRRADGAARSILGGSSKEALSNMAEDWINQKYSQSIARLNNLASISQPLLKEISLNGTAYSQELLQKWQEESAQVLAPAPVAHVTDQSGSAMAPVSMTADISKLTR